MRVVAIHRLSALALCGLCPWQAWAAEGGPASPLDDRFALRASYAHAAVSSEGRFDSDTGAPGTSFSAEDDLGLDDQVDQGRLELTFRMRDRHRLRVDYFRLERYGEAVLDRRIDFRNQTFNPGDRVATTLDWRMMGLIYGWSLWKSDDLEFTVGGGIHLTEAESLAQVEARGIRERGSAFGVLPTIGVGGSWRIAPRWSLNGHLQYLEVDIDEASGSFRDFHLDVQYRWKPNVALGLGYSLLGLKAEVSDADLPGRLDIEARGPEAFFRVSF